MEEKRKRGIGFEKIHGEEWNIRSFKREG